MLKKIFGLLIGGLLTFSVAKAQDFQFVFPNPSHDTTQGTTVFQQGDFSHNFVQLRNFIKNISNQPYKVRWRLITVDTTVDTSNEVALNNRWFVTGICDNILCRGEFGAWYYGNSDISNTVVPDTTMLIEVNVYAPTSSPDTSEVFKVELKSPNQTDTAVFVLTKVHGTGISSIALSDNRVAVYPNPLPANGQLHLFVNKDLRADKVVIYNLIGQKQAGFALAGQSELHSLNVGNLPSGMYIVKIVGVKGQVITSRKFIKQ